MEDIVDCASFLGLSVIVNIVSILSQAQPLNDIMTVFGPLKTACFC